MCVGSVAYTSNVFWFRIQKFYSSIRIPVLMSGTKRKRAKVDDGKNLIEELTARVHKIEHAILTFTKEVNEIKSLLAEAKGNSTDTTKLSLFSESTETDGVNTVSNNNFTYENGYVVVYTDGACENNGKPNAKAGIGVYFGRGSPLNVSRPVTGRATNNTAEIQACSCALKIAFEHGIQKLKIKTDSQFVINSITQWIHKWKKNNWKVASGADVKNKEDFVKLDAARNRIESVEWEYIEGHKGHIGNEEADRLARNGASLYTR